MGWEKVERWTVPDAEYKCVFLMNFAFLKHRGFSHFDSEPNHRSVCLLKERICRDLRLEMLWNPRFVRTRRKSNAFYFGENRCPANFNTQQCSIIMQSQNTLQSSWYVLILWLFLRTQDIKYLDVRSLNFHVTWTMSQVEYPKRKV